MIAKGKEINQKNKRIVEPKDRDANLPTFSLYMDLYKCIIMHREECKNNTYS